MSLYRVLMSYAPIAGSGAGLLRASYTIYNATSPAEALKNGLIQVAVDCSPPIKYPLLCAHLLGSIAVTVSTGYNPVSFARH